MLSNDLSLAAELADAKTEAGDSYRLNKYVHLTDPSAQEEMIDWSLYPRS